MEKYVFFLILFLFLNLNQNIRAQEVLNTQKDSLEKYADQKDLDAYFRVLAASVDTAILHSDRESLISLSKLARQNFGELSPAQRMSLRLITTRLGQKMYRLTGNVDESLKLYLVANENVQNKITLDSLAWYIENQIMNLYTMKGEYEKAKYFGHLLEASLRHYAMYEFLSRYYVNLGLILKSELKLEQAVKSFEKGLHLADSIKYNVGMFANTLNLAGVYNEHPELGSAEQYLLQAGELLPSLISDSRYLEKKASFEIESANYKCLKGAYSESIPLYHEAIQTLSQYYPNTARREFAKYYTSLASAYIQMDSFSQADRAIHMGLSSLIPEFSDQDEIPHINQLFPENSFIDLLTLKAQIYEKQDTTNAGYEKLKKALRCVDLALDVNDLIRETVIADPSKLVSIRSNKELIERGVAILFQLHTTDRTGEFFLKARSLFNRSKSILYNDKTRRNSLAGILSTKDRELWAAMQDTIVTLYEEKFEDTADINMINGRILGYQEKIDKLFSGYHDVILDTLVPEQYIEYLVAGDGIYTLSVLNGRQQFLKIGLYDQLQDLVNRLNEYISQKSMSLDDRILKDMYSFLVKPLTDQLPAHVVIIPDGAIGYVPFEMLQDDDGKFLLEISTISYSYEYVTYKGARDDADKPLEVFCLAPRYKMKERKAEEISRGSIYDLPFAKMEVDSIRNLYGASAQTSRSGDKAELDQKLYTTHIFHYAGHAIIRNDKAYLALNDSGDEKQQWTSNEIGLKHHALDLVVLSACETGLGKMEQGEGIRSLGRSFMESGARSTVISLWNVNDQSTAIIMTGFYKYLRQGIRKDEALRQSKWDYIKNVQSAFAHPYFWAAFIPAGDMGALNAH